MEGERDEGRAESFGVMLRGGVVYSTAITDYCQGCADDEALLFYNL